MSVTTVASGPRRRGRSAGSRRSLARWRASLALETSALDHQHVEQAVADVGVGDQPATATERPAVADHHGQGVALHHLPVDLDPGRPGRRVDAGADPADQVGGRAEGLLEPPWQGVGGGGREAGVDAVGGPAGAAVEQVGGTEGGHRPARRPRPPGRGAGRWPGPGRCPSRPAAGPPAGRRRRDSGSPLATSWTVPSPPNTISTSTSPASSAARVSASPGSLTGYTGARPNRPRSSRSASGRRSQAANPTWAMQAGHPPATLHGGGEVTVGGGGGNNPAWWPSGGGVGCRLRSGPGRAGPRVRGAHRRAAPSRDPGAVPAGPAAVRQRQRQRPAGQPRARAPELPAGGADPAL